MARGTPVSIRRDNVFFSTRFGNVSRRELSSNSTCALARHTSAQQGEETGYGRGITLKGTS